MSKTDRYHQALLSHRYVSRRGLFRAFKNASQGAIRTPPDGTVLPFPPGALPAPLFYRKCTQCRQCIAACPVGVLVAHEDGFPSIAIEYASCDGCLRCVEACTAEALLPPDPFDTKLRPRIKLGCVNRNRTCAQCVSSCPMLACSLGEDGFPIIDSDRCNGCGECSIQCDYHAIEMVYQPLR